MCEPRRADILFGSILCCKKNMTRKMSNKISTVFMLLKLYTKSSNTTFAWLTFFKSFTIFGCKLQLLATTYRQMVILSFAFLGCLVYTKWVDISNAVWVAAVVIVNIMQWSSRHNCFDSNYSFKIGSHPPIILHRKLGTPFCHSFSTSMPAIQI